MQLTDVEIRVLGSLLEKQRTTPDAYPLSLNALRLACNQSTNRDPVVDYDESALREALTRLGRMRYTRLTSTQGSRAAKFRHLLDEALGLSVAEQAVMAVLMLRGPQTPGELRQRTERIHRFTGSDALGETLEALIARRLVERLPRRPGQKEERYRHLLGGGPNDAGAAPAAGADAVAAGGPAGLEAALTAGDEPSAPSAAAPTRSSAGPASAPPAPGTHPAPTPASVSPQRVERLERQVAELAAELAEIRRELGLDAPR